MKILIESSLDSSIKQQALLGKMIDFLIKSIHARLTRIARFILEEFFFCAFPDLRFRSIPRYWTIHYGIFFSNYVFFFSTPRVPRPKMAQDGPKMVPRWLQEGPRWPQEGPRWPQDAARWSQDGPKMAQDGPKMSLRWPKMSQNAPKMTPR